MAAGLSSQENRMERGDPISTTDTSDHLQASGAILRSVLSSATTDVEESNPATPTQSGWSNTLRSWTKDLQQPLIRIRNGFFPPNNSTIPRQGIIRKLENCPQGYPRLAALLDCDESFMVYRRFGFLQSRLLLYKQDRLRELEAKLDKYDKQDGEEYPQFLISRVRDDALSPEGRMKLLAEIESLFREYTSLLLVARDLAALDRPPPRDYLSVKYFLDKEPLAASECYIDYREDMISLKPGRERTWLDGVVESILLIFSCRLIRYIFSSLELRLKADAETLTLFKRERIEVVVSLIITLVILILLVIPVWLLWQLEQTFQMAGALSKTTAAKIIGVLLSFTFVFSVVLLLFTRAKRHEILASAAAYCAVLVVFIGNVGQLSQNSTASNQ